MKTLFRWAFRLLILVIVLLVAAILLMDVIVKAIVEKGLRQETGLDVRIGNTVVGIWDPRLTIENLMIYNSAEFGGSPMLNIPELHLETDWNALRGRTGHLKLIRVNLAEINIVVNQTGTNNFDALRIHSGLPAANPSGNASSHQTGGIDTLNLSIGTVRQIDLKKPESNREYVLNLKNQVIQGLNSGPEAEQKLNAVFGRLGLSSVVHAFFPTSKSVTNAPAPPSAGKK